MPNVGEDREVGMSYLVDRITNCFNLFEGHNINIPMYMKKAFILDSKSPILEIHFIKSICTRIQKYTYTRILIAILFVPMIN